MNLDNTNKHKLKFPFKLTRPNIMAVMNRKLDIRQMIGDKYYQEMLEYLQSQKTEDDLVKFLINPVGLYTEPTKEPKLEVLTAIIDKYGIVIDEQFEFRHESMDENGNGVINDKKLTCMPLYVRANQQIADKEGKSAEEDTGRNVAGQVSSKTSKSGAFTDSEISVAIAQDANAVMEELLGPSSHDLTAKKEMKAQLYKTGSVKLKDLTQQSGNKRSLMYFSEILKSISIDSDLIEPIVTR